MKETYLHPDMEIAGLRHIGDVISMNTRLHAVLRYGTKLNEPLEQLEEQIEFLGNCMNASRLNVINIGFDDMGTIFSMMQSLYDEIQKRKAELESASSDVLSQVISVIEE